MHHVTLRLPDLLRAYRERASLTQDEAAAQLKMGRSTLVRYENRKGSPPFDVLAALLEAYGVTWHQLADDLEPDAALRDRDPSGADERLVATLLDTIELLKSSRDSWRRITPPLRSSVPTRHPLLGAPHHAGMELAREPRGADDDGRQLSGRDRGAAGGRASRGTRHRAGPGACAARDRRGGRSSPADE